MRHIFKFAILVLISPLNRPVLAQNEGLIYGEIILKDKSSVTGPIRWSGGQLLWTDVLQVSKTNTYILNYLSKAERDDLSTRDIDAGLDWQFTNLFKEKLPARENELFCRFGDIASIHITSTSQAQIYLKNGLKIRVLTDQVQNKHLRTNVAVYNGKIQRIQWDQISRINFRDAPQNFSPFRGSLLYGTVSTSAGELTGFIKWDMVKFLSTQNLQGKIGNSDENSEYQFDLIHSIQKKDNGAVVRFKSKQEILMHRNGDVSSSNRGIVVMHPIWGRAIVEWEAFRSVSFMAVPHDLGYQKYLPPKKLSVSISTIDGETLRGECTFDLDEDWNVELLEGSNGKVHFQIPFHQIHKIIPQDSGHSKVVLKNNNVLNLGAHNDVTQKNWGLMIWMANSKHQYIPWYEIEEVDFN